MSQASPANSTGRADAGTPALALSNLGAPTPPSFAPTSPGVHGETDPPAKGADPPLTEPSRISPVGADQLPQAPTNSVSVPHVQPSDPLLGPPPPPPAQNVPSEELSQAFRLVLEQMLPAVQASANSLFDTLAVPSPSESSIEHPDPLLSSTPVLPDAAATNALQLHTFLSSILQVLQQHGMAGLPILPSSPPNHDLDAMQTDSVPRVPLPHDLVTATEQYAVRSKREFDKAQRLRDASEIVRDVLAGGRTALASGSEAGPSGGRRARPSAGPLSQTDGQPPAVKKPRGNTPVSSGGGGGGGGY